MPGPAAPDPIRIERRFDRFSLGFAAPAIAHTPPAARARRYPRLARSGGDSPASLNDLGGLEEDVLREGETECLGGLEGDHELELPGLLDREVGWLGAF